MPFADSNGVKIHYETAGQGDPLLLIMGFGMPGAAWLLSLPYFTPNFEVAYFDNRGTGASDVPGDGYEIPVMARDACAVLDALGWERAHVYGVSMGGMIAQQLALDFPGRVRSLVLGCTSSGEPEPTPEVLAARRQLAESVALMKDDPERAIDLMLPLSFTDAFLERHPEVRTAMLAFVKAAPTQKVPEIPEDGGAPGQWETASRLGEIAVPALILHGTEDRLIPLEHGYRLFEGIPRAEMRIFKGVGHTYQAFGQALIDRCIAEWLSALKSLPPG
jgi:3-oxoadipate enol-lactonase